MEKIGINALPIIIPLALFLWLVFIIIAIHLQMRQVFRQGQSKVTELSLGVVFLVVVLLLSPDISQSLYWWNGMRTYSLPLIILTLYVILLQVGVERLITRKQIAIGGAVSFLFIFINGGLGETYTAFQVVVLVFLMILELLVSKDNMSPRFRLLLGGLIGSIAALIMVVAAPGNTIRQGYFPPSPSVVRLFQISLQGYLDFIFGIVRSPEKVTGLLGAVLMFVYFGAHCERGPTIDRRLIPLLLLGAFGLSFACFVPAAYGTSEVTPARTIIIPVFALVTCLLWAGFLVGQGITGTGQVNVPVGNVISIVAVLLIVYSTSINVQYLYSSRNIYIEFAQKWDKVDALILQANARGDETVTIPAMNVWTGPGGDPTDNPKYWVNRCYSLYYGITVLGPNPDLQQP